MTPTGITQRNRTATDGSSLHHCFRYALLFKKSSLPCLQELGSDTVKRIWSLALANLSYTRSKIFGILYISRHYISGMCTCTILPVCQEKITVMEHQGMLGYNRPGITVQGNLIAKSSPTHSLLWLFLQRKQEESSCTSQRSLQWTRVSKPLALRNAPCPPTCLADRVLKRDTRCSNLLPWLPRVVPVRNIPSPIFNLRPADYQSASKSLPQTTQGHDCIFAALVSKAIQVFCHWDRRNMTQHKSRAV